MSKKNLKGIFLNGILDENPTFRLVLGTCPTLAVTTSASNGVGMGIAATVVLMGSNLVISSLRNFIPKKVRIPSFIVIICMFVTMVQMLLKAYLPELNDALGVFIPLIVVNCIILARAEAFASKNGPLASLTDGLGMGLGFTLALTLMGSIREIIGAGTIFGVSILGASYDPMKLITVPAGGFLTYGLLLGIINAITNKKKNKNKKEDK